MAARTAPAHITAKLHEYRAARDAQQLRADAFCNGLTGKLAGEEHAEFYGLGDYAGHGVEVKITWKLWLQQTAGPTDADVEQLTAALDTATAWVMVCTDAELIAELEAHDAAELDEPAATLEDTTPADVVDAAEHITRTATVEESTVSSIPTPGEQSPHPTAAVIRAALKAAGVTTPPLTITSGRADTVVRATNGGRFTRAESLAILAALRPLWSDHVNRVGVMWFDDRTTTSIYVARSRSFDAHVVTLAEVLDDLVDRATEWEAEAPTTYAGMKASELRLEVEHLEQLSALEAAGVR